MRKSDVRNWYSRLPAGAIIVVHGQAHIKPLNDGFSLFWHDYKHKLGRKWGRTQLMTVISEGNRLRILYTQARKERDL